MTNPTGDALKASAAQVTDEMVAAYKAAFQAHLDNLPSRPPVNFGWNATKAALSAVAELLPRPAGAPALDASTEQKLREALRFAASRSVMAADDEKRILAALSPVEQAPQPARLDLAKLIKSRLIGVDPDDQDLQLEDEDWNMICAALEAGISPAEQAPQPVAGIELAARFVEKRLNDYVEEHGSTDWETGAMEFPGNGDEYVGELEEIIEGIRALNPAPTEAPPVESQAAEINVDKIAKAIVLAACELDDTPDPDDDDTILITVQDLEAVAHRHITVALERAALAAEGSAE